MPELPEVETVVRGLRPKLTGKKISDFHVSVPRFFFGHKTDLIGSKIINVERRAKNIVLKLDNGQNAVLHLKMSGQLLFSERAGKTMNENKHTRAVFYFKGGSKLLFNDARRFGYIKIMDDKALLEFFRAVGPEPLLKIFTLEIFGRVLKAHPKRMIKPLLLDQSVLAGLGNIYADESLYRARIRPTRRAAKITLYEARDLYLAIRSILNSAIKYQGTSVRSYRTAKGAPGRYAARLKVYGRAGLTCERDGGTITRIVIGSRSSHYCPRCQT